MRRASRGYGCRRFTAEDAEGRRGARRNFSWPSFFRTSWNRGIQEGPPRDLSTSSERSRPPESPSRILVEGRVQVVPPLVGPGSERRTASLEPPGVAGRPIPPTRGPPRGSRVGSSTHQGTPEG